MAMGRDFDFIGSVLHFAKLAGGDEKVKSKLELRQVVLAAGITGAIIYVICALAYVALPKPAFDLLWKPMFHWLYGASATTLVLGFVETLIYSAVAAAIFVGVYNYLMENKG